MWTETTIQDALRLAQCGCNLQILETVNYEQHIQLTVLKVGHASFIISHKIPKATYFGMHWQKAALFSQGCVDKYADMFIQCIYVYGNQSFIGH